MKKQLTLFFIFCLFVNIAFAQSLVKVWECDSLLLKPESALYDQNLDLIYVSNINGEYLAKDGNGFISTLKPNGEIACLKWAEGMDNPQGLGLVDNHLFVADIDRVVIINTDNGKVEETISIEGAQFLNDITTDSNGDVYVSDCRWNIIFRIRNGKAELWLDNPKLAAPNGLLCTPDYLFIVNMEDGLIYQTDKNTKEMIQLSSGIVNGDGISSDGSGGFFISGAWQGEVFHADTKGQKSLILDLGKQRVIAADLSYIPDLKLLLVPTLYKTVLAFRWNQP